MVLDGPRAAVERQQPRRASCLRRFLGNQLWWEVEIEFVDAHACPW
jgi:hypothetical protein